MMSQVHTLEWNALLPTVYASPHWLESLRTDAKLVAIKLLRKCSLLLFYGQVHCKALVWTSAQNERMLC